MAPKNRKAAAHKNAPTLDQRRARTEMCLLSAAWNDQMNDYLASLVYTTSAIVPEEEGWHGEQKAPQTIAKP